MKMRLTFATLCRAVVATTIFGACGGTLAAVQLQPEAPATLHIGEIAVLRVTSERHYAIGGAGSALVLMNQTDEEDTTSYFYRAVRAGNQTFVATPRDPGPDRCISCVTAHYFVTVIE
jgi:hypothetical protein